MAPLGSYLHSPVLSDRKRDSLYQAQKYIFAIDKVG